MAKDKSVFFTTLYLRSLGMFFGSAIACAILGNLLLRKEDYYPQISGEIVDSQLRWEQSPYDILLNTSEHVWYTYISEYFDTLSKNANVGQSATIWYDKKDHSIRKLVVDGNVVIPYKKNVGLYVVLLCLVVAWGTFNAIYLIKNTSHLAGKRDETVI